MTDVPLQDDADLLRAMMLDDSNQTGTYRAGPFWQQFAADAARQLLQKGVTDFRGSSSSVGFGFTDCVYTDVRTTLGEPSKDFFSRAFRKLQRQLPQYREMAALLERQVQLTRDYETWWRNSKRSVAARNPRTRELLAKYVLPNSTKGGCLDTLSVDGRIISRHYLNLLDQHDRVAAVVDFRNARSVCEIGGGFGVNLHILIENYPNLRKFVYLDIVPNLYVGT